MQGTPQTSFIWHFKHRLTQLLVTSKLNQSQFILRTPFIHSGVTQSALQRSRQHIEYLPMINDPHLYHTLSSLRTPKCFTLQSVIYPFKYTFTHWWCKPHCSRSCPGAVRKKWGCHSIGTTGLSVGGQRAQGFQLNHLSVYLGKWAKCLAHRLPNETPTFCTIMIREWKCL